MTIHALPKELEADALCAQSDPEAFFPDKGQSAEPARRICGRCPILDECLDHALAQDGEVFGIWGGLTQRDRREIRRGNAARPERRVVAA
ncbi:WhiB family transcription factor [Mycobacterium phage Chris]|uniref:WhiB family transcription factor n=1 Tax=Mycobacterium phage Chris TaxID=2725626 RepID=A0A6M3SWU8_9CAUD|nr:WhiB family transcription factor [Mycobacterium phage Chris]QJD50455.1 WhiB family transcription factor [Mycobacterium phage Chris]